MLNTRRLPLKTMKMEDIHNCEAIKFLCYVKVTYVNLGLTQIVNSDLRMWPNLWWYKLLRGTALTCIPKYHHVIILGGSWYPFGREAKASVQRSVLPSLCWAT